MAFLPQVRHRRLAFRQAGVQDASAGASEMTALGSKETRLAVGGGGSGLSYSHDGGLNFPTGTQSCHIKVRDNDIPNSTLQEA
jgi:hypothetical protein